MTTETNAPAGISRARAACEAFWATIGPEPGFQRPGEAWGWAVSQGVTGAWEAAAKAAAGAAGRDEAAAIREQAKRYLVAVHGDDWLYRAPETFAGPERWVWAVANGQGPLAATAIADVERVCAEHRKGETP